jgi:hypothetical protein
MKHLQKRDYENQMVSPENWPLQELLMGVETPIPPKMITTTAPDGAPPRRIKTVEIIICRFSWLGCEPDRFMLVSPVQKKNQMIAAVIPITPD